MPESHENAPKISEDNFSPEKGIEVFRGNFVRVTTEERDGRKFERVYVRNGICAIPITSEGKIRFIREIDWDTQKHRIKLVSGYIHENEAPLLCAQRELGEEIGVTGEKWEPFLVSTNEEATVQKTQYYFVVRELKEGEAQPDADENIQGYIDL